MIPQIHADSQLVIFAFADDYSFGILSSELHWSWTLARGGTLESRPCYTSDTVFDTFPWPQKPKRCETAEVAAAAVALRTLRREREPLCVGIDFRSAPYGRRKR